MTLKARITEFFTLQGLGKEEYDKMPKSEEEAVDCFMSDLGFGTAGLRSEMDVGFNRMNEVTVRLASMGIAKWLKGKKGGSLVVIGHDHRHNSALFARSAAQVFRAYGHKVRVFPQIVPTPFVPAAIQCVGAGLGVMMTASHNPRKDNGYKVYGGNGAQIIDSDAKEIVRFISEERARYIEIRDRDTDSWDTDDSLLLLKEVKAWYIEKLKGFLSTLGDNSKSQRPRVVYTALHGVGGDYVDELFSELFQDAVCHVEEQRRPDPDFPTVDFPNPEEGPSTLKMAMAVAESEGIDVIFANDPDADRFCLAERQRSNSDNPSGRCWRVFNGNEIAVLLADFISCHVQEGDQQCAMLGSCVSSRFLKVFCEKRSWRFESTRTGFKNLGNAGLRLKGEGFKVLLAFEEAIGFQVGDWNFDKDGLSAMAVAYKLLCSMGKQQSLLNQLESIYEREGVWPVQCNGYYFCKPASRIKKLLSEIKVEDNHCNIRSLKSSEGTVEIEFEVEGLGSSAWIMLRSSGTEPKLKYYSEMMLDRGITSDIALKYEGAVEEILRGLLDPAKNNLIKKT